MKAVVLKDFGGPEVLRYEDVPTPDPGPGEILVKVHSVSVNRTLDLVVRQGTYPVKIQLPHVLGVDPAGVIAALGDGDQKLNIGDRVAVISYMACRKCRHCKEGREDTCLNARHIGLHRWGGYAEYVVAPARNTFLIPPNLSFAEASVITRHFPMAFNLLSAKAEVRPGERVLVMGAAGALGSCCIQVGKMLGATVIAAAGSDERVAVARSYGAEFGVNYRRQNLANEVMKLTGGDGVDVVCENIADPTLWPGAFNSLARGGRMVTAGGHGGGEVMLDVKRLYLNRLRIIGAAGTNISDVEKSLEAARAGKIRAIIDRTMPLSAAANAHRLVGRNQTVGKVILDPTKG
jgi:NADPH2:quinone reductase